MFAEEEKKSSENGRGDGKEVRTGHWLTRGVNHSLEISYTLARNPIVLQEIPKKSFCFNRNLVRFSSK